MMMTIIMTMIMTMMVVCYDDDYNGFYIECIV